MAILLLQMNINECLQEYEKLSTVIDFTAYSDGPIPMSLRFGYGLKRQTAHFDSGFNKEISRLLDQRPSRSVDKTNTSAFQLDSLRCKTYVHIRQ
jgi:hypothetical protein